MGVFPLFGTTRDSVPEDTVYISAIEFDQQKYNAFKSRKKFDYYQQFEKDDSGWWREMEMKFYRWLRKNFSSNLTKKQYDQFLVLGVVVLLVLLILFFYIYKPSLFYLERKRKLNYRIEDEEIDGVNVDLLIRKALEQEEFDEAIRWKYLKVLQALNEKELISFDANKTVNEYVYEITRTDLKPEFKDLSLRFAYYRYGNGEASLAVFNDFSEQSNRFLKQIYN